MLICPSVSPNPSLLAMIHSSSFDRGWNAEVFSGLFTIPDTVAFIAPDDSGFGILRVVMDEAEVITLAVLPHCRRKGTGRLIISSMLEYAVGRKVKSVFLEVKDDNDRAKTLYIAQGFTVMSRRRNYYRDNDGTETDAIVMRKVL